MNAILGQKLGMTQIFDDEARAIPVTVVKAGPVQVVQIKTMEKDGYNAIQISYGDVKSTKVNQPQAGSLRQSWCFAGFSPGRDQGRRSLSIPTGPGDQGRRHLRGRDQGRCLRSQQRKGLLRGHEASQLQGPGCLPRQPQEASRSRFDRRLRHSSPCLQGNAHGRPDGWGEGHDSQPRGRWC